VLNKDLERFNEWWFTGRVRKELALPFRRYAFSNILKSISDRQITMLTGLRRVGKTTLMYQMIEELVKFEDPFRILYFSFDESLASPKEVLEYYEKRVLKKPFEEAGRVYVFFDEIQYIKDWASMLKQFYDLYPNLKFFVSGSSSLLLSKDAMEKLAGRFFLFELKPLMFSEFLEMKGLRKENMDIFPRRIEAYFFDYLRKSGFPEIVNWENDAKIAEYVRYFVIDRIILKDIPYIFRTRDMILLERIVRLILSNPGCIINANSLSRDWEEDKRTILNYLKFLEISLLIRSLSNFRPSYLSSSRKLKKYYPAMPSLIFSYSKEIFEKDLGAVLETYVVNFLNASYYFRKNGKEINIVLKGQEELLPIEVKEKVSEEDLRRFSNLISYINAKRGIIISLNQTMKRSNIEVMPVYLIEEFFKNFKSYP
jgi:predicted AAA+ superfamily ATPase